MTNTPGDDQNPQNPQDPYGDDSQGERPGEEPGEHPGDELAARRRTRVVGG